MNLQLLPFANQSVQEVSEFDGKTVRNFFAFELQATVDVPPDDQQRALGKKCRFAERVKVLRTVDEQSDPIGMLDLPTVLSGRQNGGLAHIAPGST